MRKIERRNPTVFPTGWWNYWLPDNGPPMQNLNLMWRDTVRNIHAQKFIKQTTTVKA
jgi:hypothetical protein